LSRGEGACREKSPACEPLSCTAVADRCVRDAIGTRGLSHHQSSEARRLSRRAQSGRAADRRRRGAAVEEPARASGKYNSDCGPDHDGRRSEADRTEPPASDYHLPASDYRCQPVEPTNTRRRAAIRKAGWRFLPTVSPADGRGSPADSGAGGNNEEPRASDHTEGERG